MGIQTLIVYLSVLNVVNPALMVSICFQETRLKHTIVQDKGSLSYGACQIKRAAANEVGISRPELMTERGSIEAAVKYFKLKLKECAEINSAIGAYNTGKCVKNPNKNKYIKQVMNYYKKFKNKNLLEERVK